MKYLCLLLCITVLMSGCASDDLTNKTLTHSPDFAPVYPLASDANRIPTGGIYGNRQSDAWFGRGRNFQVGDIITVLLDESTQAARTSNSDLSRESKNAGLPSGLSTEVGKVSPFLQGIDLSSSNMTSKGKGVADQKATLKGSLAVTVVEVLANGNLMVRGEKKTRFGRRHRGDSSLGHHPPARRGPQQHRAIAALGQCPNCLPRQWRCGQRCQSRVGHQCLASLLAFLTPHLAESNP